MTAFEVLEMNRVAYKRECRRRELLDYCFRYIKVGFLIFAVSWGYANRAELMRRLQLVPTVRAAYQSVHVQR